MKPDDLAHWQAWVGTPEWRAEVLHGPDDGLAALRCDGTVATSATAG
jgi:hypothetical protein